MNNKAKESGNAYSHKQNAAKDTTKQAKLANALKNNMLRRKAAKTKS